MSKRNISVLFYQLLIAICYLNVCVSADSYEHPVITRSGQVGLGHMYSAKTLGIGHLVINLNNEFSYDKSFVREILSF